MNIKSIVLLLTIALLISSCKSNIKEDFWQGKIKRETLSISSKVPGRVIERRVNDGDFVKTGDTLLILDIPEVEAKMLQAEGALLAAKSDYEMAKTGATGEQLRQIEAKVMAAKEQYHFASNTIKRLEPMYKDSLISTQQYEEAVMKAQAAKAQYDAAIAKQDEVVAGVRNEKIKMALGQLQRAQGAHEEVEAAYQEQFVIAPKDLEVSSVNVRVGELAMAGYTLVSAFETGSAYFRFTIPEHEITKYQAGKKLDVTLAFEKVSVPSVIQSIRQLPRYADKTTVWPENEIGESTFEIKAIPVNTSQLDHKFNNTTVLLDR